MATYQYKAGLGKRLDTSHWASSTEHTGGNLIDSYLQSMPKLLLYKPIIRIDRARFSFNLGTNSYTITGTFARTQDWNDIIATLQIGDTTYDIEITNDYTWEVEVSTEVLSANTTNIMIAFIYGTNPFTAESVVNSTKATYTLIGNTEVISCSGATNSVIFNSIYSLNGGYDHHAEIGDIYVDGVFITTIAGDPSPSSFVSLSDVGIVMNMMPSVGYNFTFRNISQQSKRIEFRKSANATFCGNFSPPLNDNPTVLLYNTSETNELDLYGNLVNSIGDILFGSLTACLSPVPSISCEGASNGVFWPNTSNYFMKEYIEGTVTFTMEFNGIQFTAQAMVGDQSYPGYFMETAIDWYNSNNGTSLNISIDGLVYHITGAVSENTIRIKFYTDGAALFEAAEEDVGNITYQELDGRIGFQVCIEGVGG